MLTPIIIAKPFIRNSKYQLLRVKYIKKEMVGIRKLRLYLETTAFNYYFDEDRDGHEDTVRLFEAIGAGEYEGYASVHVMS